LSILEALDTKSTVDGGLFFRIKVRTLHQNNMQGSFGSMLL